MKMGYRVWSQSDQVKIGMTEYVKEFDGVSGQFKTLYEAKKQMAAIIAFDFQGRRSAKFDAKALARAVTREELIDGYVYAICLNG